MQVYAINKPCSSAKTVSRRIVNSFPHLEAISNKLYLSGGSIGLLIGTDFPDAFVDIHVIPGSPGEPIAKRNCFGWYVMGQFSDQGDESSAIRSVDVGTVSASLCCFAQVNLDWPTVSSLNGADTSESFGGNLER